MWPGRRRRQRENDLERELRSDLELEAEEQRESGLDSEQARYAARRAFGNTTWIREEVRSMWGWRSLELLFQDIRYGVRQLRRSPGFTAVAVLTLALGIGANTAIFSAMSAAVLRYLPVHDPARLVFLNSTESINAQSGDGDTSLTDYIFEQLRTRRDVFSDLVAFAPLASGQITVRYGAEPEEAQANEVSGDFFSGLGVRPALGRIFTIEDERAHAPIAVLSYAWWTRHGQDPSVLGHPLYIKGEPFTIVGVAASGFAGVENKKVSDIWIPLEDRPDLQPWAQPPSNGLSLYGTSPRWWCLKTIGRLAHGVSEKQAVARLTPLFQRAALDGVTGRSAKAPTPQLYLTPARGIDGLREDYLRPLTVLMIMVALVLAIACANIAMLLLARQAARRREFCLRMAIGGNRVRLLRQLLTESLLLVSMGAVLGWVFALWATRLLTAWSHLDVSFAPDRSVLLFTLALSLLAALVFGLAPLRGIVNLPLGSALRTSAAAANQDRSKFRAGQMVVAAQIAFCLALLVGAGLLVGTLRNLENVNVGIRASGLLVFGVSPIDQTPDAGRIRFYQALLGRMRALPGVEGATLMRQRIGSGWSSNSSVRVDGVDPRGDGNSHIRYNGVAADYFHVLGTPVLRGRDFTDADSATAPHVAIVNQTFARMYMPGRDPLGHQLTRGDNPPATIVGIVADLKYTGVQEEAMPMAWFPYAQFTGITSMNVELRTFADPVRLLPEVRRAMREFAPDLPLLQPMTQEEQLERSYSQGRLVARLAIFFGLLAALLVATGLYGTLSYTVGRRTAEVGVRMALGARRAQVLWMVLRGSLLVSLAGVVIGMPLAIAGARFLQTMLFGISPGDPRIFVLAFAGLVAVVLAASLIPARRASSVDPAVALRQE